MTRIEREQHTIRLMVAIYCRHHHHSGQSLCDSCAALADYACKRLSRCPHGNAKSSCQRCAVHCYAPAYRAQVRAVMRYVGPRMIFYHPVAALRHLLNI